MTLFYFIPYPTAILAGIFLAISKLSSAGKVCGAPFKVAKAAPNSSIDPNPCDPFEKNPANPADSNYAHVSSQN